MGSTRPDEIRILSGESASDEAGELRLRVESEAGSATIAAVLASLLGCGSVAGSSMVRGTAVGLTGELGSGKTAFVRAFLHSLHPGIRVQSPTYVLEHVYEIAGPPPLSVSHWDLYRLKDGEAPEELVEAIRTNSVVFIEWPERSARIIGMLDLHVVLGYPTEVESFTESPRPDAMSARKRSAKALSQKAPSEEARVFVIRSSEARLLRDFKERLVKNGARADVRAR